MDTDQLISTGEAAAILGVSPQTMRRYADRQYVTTTRTLGGRRLYSEKEIRNIKNQLNETRTA